ncbi:hypothetical protein LTR12_004779 [Friedmanniomyces endolithicus]|nr:hypothetical protein LTR12_004779 [Friedmanniomyces endolithicus]
MTSGNVGSSTGSERNKDTRRDSRRKASREDDTVTDARSEESKAVMESGPEEFKRVEGNMADIEDAGMRSGRFQGKPRPYDLPQASLGEGISGLQLRAMTIATQQLSGFQAMVDEEMAWRQTIRQQLRAEGMSDLRDHVAVEQQALEWQRSEMTISPPGPDHMASQPASTSPAAAPHSTQRSIAVQQTGPEHMASEAIMPSEPNTFTAPSVKQQRYDFNRLARKIQTSNLSGNSESATSPITPSPLPTPRLNNPYPAAPGSQADEMLSTPDPSPAPPIPPRSQRRPSGAEDQSTPNPADNESAESIRQHEMDAAVARQQQLQQGTFERVSLSLPVGMSGGIGARGAGGRIGGAAEMPAVQGVRAHEYEFGVLLEGLDDLEVLVGNSRGKRKGVGRLSRAEWSERRECWVLFSVGQLEGLVSSAEVQGRKSGRRGGEMGADGERDGVAIGTVKYLGELMRRVQEGAAAMTTTTTRDEFPAVKVVINSLDDIITLLRSSALLRRRGTAPGEQIARRKAAGIWRIHYLEDLHELVSLWEREHPGVDAGSVGVAGAKGRVVLSSWDAILIVSRAAKLKLKAVRARERARERAEAEARWRELVESHRPQPPTPSLAPASPGQQADVRGPPPPTPRLAPAVTFGELLRGAKAHASDVRGAAVPESPRLIDDLEVDDSDDMDEHPNDMTDLTAQVAADEEEEDTVVMRPRSRPSPRRNPGYEYENACEDPIITAAEATRARRLSEERNAEIEREVQARKRKKKESATPVEDKPKKEEETNKVEEVYEDFMADNEEMAVWAYKRGKSFWGLDDLAHEQAFKPQPQATRDQAKVEQYLKEWSEDGGEALVPLLDRSGIDWRGHRIEMEQMMGEATVENEDRLEQYQVACEIEGGTIQYGPMSGIPMRLTFQEHEKETEKVRDTEALACENAAMRLELKASRMRWQAAIEQQRRMKGM